jgi:repressor of nif and glnA expression
MDTGKERYKRIRGAILKLLAYQHPGAVDFKVLHYLLDDLGYTISEQECESHVCYLAEKSLVNKNKRKSGGITIYMVTVTPRGLDVLDGFVAEAGVDTNF